MRALSGRLTFVVGGIVILAIVAVSLAGYLSGRTVIERQIHDRVEASSAATMATVDAYLSARAEELRTMANGNLTIHSLSAQDKTRILSDFESAFGNNRYNEIAIVNADGSVAESSVGSPDYKSHPELLKTFAAATKPGITDLTTFTDLSTPVFVVYTPILDDTGARAGVLVGRLQTAEIADLVRTVPVDEHTSLFLTHRGTALAEHRGAAAPTMKDAANGMMARADEKAGGMGLGLAVVVAVDRGAALAPVTRLALQSAIVGLVALLLAMAAIVVMARGIARPLNDVAHAAQQLAAGNLDARVMVTRSDVRETIELADAFNTMSETLHALLGGVEHASRTVSLAVRENVVVSDSVREGTEEQAAALSRISSALSEVAANARAIGQESDNLERSAQTGLGRLDELVREVEGTQVALHQLRASIDTSNDAGVQLAQQSVAVAERAREVGRRAESAQQSADTGSDHVRRLVADIRNVGDHLTATVDRLEHLADATASAISAQLEVINDIAERSKLLALNAGIEAARAGEHGRGFGVIAQELHRLASGSKHASAEVGALVGSVVAETTALVTSARAASDLANGAIDRAAETGDAIDSLVSEIRENANGAREIGAIADDQATRTAELERATAEMRRMAESTSRAAQAVGALSRDVRVAVDLATTVAAQVAGAVREQTTAFDVMERGAVEIQSTTTRVAEAARRSFDATDTLQREVDSLVATVNAFGGKGGDDGHGSSGASGAERNGTGTGSALAVPSFELLVRAN